jgi:hypothetical protein
LGQDVLSLYRYGRALARVGDDGTHIELKRFLAKSELAPHVTWWLSQVADKLKKSWQDRMSKWPQPFVSLEGTIEVIEGEAGIGGFIIPAIMTLWREPQQTLTDFGDWGGFVRLLDLTPGRLFEVLNRLGETISLSSPGRRNAQSLMVKTMDEGFLVTGNGPFPDVVDDV